MNKTALTHLWENVGCRLEEQVLERPDERLGLCTLTKEVCALSSWENKSTYLNTLEAMLTKLNRYKPRGVEEWRYWWPRDDEDYFYRMMICQHIIDSL